MVYRLGMVEGNSAQRYGVILYNTFLEGPSLRPLAVGLEPLDPDEYEAVFREAFAPLTFVGQDVASIMDDGDLSPIRRAEMHRSRFPVKAAGLFYDGWTAVALRLASVVDAGRAYREAPNLANSERSLFDFHVHALAALDSCAFALFCLASMAHPRQFPTDRPRDLRRISADRTRAAFQAIHPNEAVTTSLREALASPHAEQILKVRNVLAHRASPAFSQAPGAHARQAIWVTQGHLEVDLDIDETSLEELEAFMRATTGQLVHDTLLFVRGSLAPRPT